MIPISPKAVEAALDSYDNPLAPYGWRNASGALQAQLRFDMERAIRAALAVDGLVIRGWRTIDSAPKDGTRVLLYSDQLDPPTIQGQWKRHDLPYQYGEWVDVWNNDLIETSTGAVAFTHWQPLPAPPLTAASDGEVG